MKLIATKDLKYGMYLAQNIYRHDSLLALPKGVQLKNAELNFIKDFNLNFVLVAEKKLLERFNDINYTLDIIESSFKNNTLLPKAYSLKLYDEIEKKILKNKKIQKYLNELRLLDSYSFAHCINIAIVVAKLLATDNHIDRDFIDIILLSLLHDVGRIKMKKIFNKEGTLSEEEFKELWKHPKYSFDLLKKVGYTEYDLKFVLETHERWDGGGYPERLKGEEISELAQIILMADVYNALSSYRPHRKAFHPYDVLMMIKDDKNKLLGEKYVELFLERFTPYQIGCKVELNDGSLAIVKSLPNGRRMLPVLEILDENTGEKLALMDLAFHKEIRIVKIIESY